MGVEARELPWLIAHGSVSEPKLAERALGAGTRARTLTDTAAADISPSRAGAVGNPTAVSFVAIVAFAAQDFRASRAVRLHRRGCSLGSELWRALRHLLVENGKDDCPAQRNYYHKLGRCATCCGRRPRGRIRQDSNIKERRKWTHTGKEPRPRRRCSVAVFSAADACGEQAVTLAQDAAFI